MSFFVFFFFRIHMVLCSLRIKNVCFDRNGGIS